MGQQYAEGYVEVEAQAAENGISTFAAGSPGIAVGGYWVSWDAASGFSGQGWWPSGTYSKDGNSITISADWSPAASYSDQQIQDEISSNNNLNTMFNSWGHSERLQWVTAMYYAGCASPDN